MWSFRIEELTHRDRVIKELRLIIHLFELAILAFDKAQKKDNPQSNRFLVFSKTMFETLIAIQQERKEQDDGDLFSE